MRSSLSAEKSEELYQCMSNIRGWNTLLVEKSKSHEMFGKWTLGPVRDSVMCRGYLGYGY